MTSAPVNLGAERLKRLCCSVMRDCGMTVPHSEIRAVCGCVPAPSGSNSLKLIAAGARPPSSPAVSFSGS